MASVTQRTPVEFAEDYIEDLKSSLGIYDLQLNKAGYIGFMANLLGQLTYDNKIYFDNLFKEAFVATASDDNLLYLHGIAYGYKGSFATSSIANGSFTLDLSLLPALDTSSTRTIKFGDFTSTEDSQLSFLANDITFTSASTYKIEYNRSSGNISGNIFITKSSDGSTKAIPFNTSTIDIPFDNFRQETIETQSITLPNYPEGSFYTYPIELESNEFISDISVSIASDDSESLESYKIQNVKYLVGSDDKVVFYQRSTTDNTYTLEFGSGIYGKYVGNRAASITIKKTLGSSGNISKSTEGTFNDLTQLIYTDGTKNSSGVLTDTVSGSLDIADYVTINFTNSESGKDVLSGSDLRKDLVYYIQARNNLVSEEDFYSVEYKYANDFRFQFKKTAIYENTVYLLKAYRDDYNNVIRTLNKSVKCFNGASIAIESATLNNGGYFVIKYPSTSTTPLKIRYLISAIDILGNKIFSPDITTRDREITADNTSIVVTWTEVANANYYLLYREVVLADGSIDRDNIIKFKIGNTTTTFKDLGWFYKEGTVSTDDGEILVEDYNTEFQTKSFAVEPTIVVDDIDMVSPYLYYYNSSFDWYDGYILHKQLLVNFNTIEKNTNNTTTTISIEPPPIYLNLLYNADSCKTKISLFSYSDLTDWSFSISSNELSISLTPMTKDTLSDREYYYEWTKNNGLIFGTFSIVIKCYYNISSSDLASNIENGKDSSLYIATASSIEQLKDVSDVVRLVKYEYIYEDSDTSSTSDTSSSTSSTSDTSSASDMYVVNIPFIESGYFSDSNREEQLKRFTDFISNNTITENRMITDNLQCRFLNSLNIRTPYLELITKQGANIYKNVPSNEHIIKGFVATPPSTTSLSKGDTFVVGGVYYSPEDEQIHINANKLPIESTHYDVSTMASYLYSEFKYQDFLSYAINNGYITASKHNFIVLDGPQYALTDSGNISFTDVETRTPRRYYKVFELMYLTDKSSVNVVDSVTIYYKAKKSGKVVYVTDPDDPDVTDKETKYYKAVKGTITFKTDPTAVNVIDQLTVYYAAKKSGEVVYVTDPTDPTITDPNTKYYKTVSSNTITYTTNSKDRGITCPYIYYGKAKINNVISYIDLVTIYYKKDSDSSTTEYFPESYIIDTENKYYKTISGVYTTDETQAKDPDIYYWQAKNYSGAICYLIGTLQYYKIEKGTTIDYVITTGTSGYLTYIVDILEVFYKIESIAFTITDPNADDDTQTSIEYYELSINNQIMYAAPSIIYYKIDDSSATTPSYLLSTSIIDTEVDVKYYKIINGSSTEYVRDPDTTGVIDKNTYYYKAKNSSGDIVYLLGTTIYYKAMNSSTVLYIINYSDYRTDTTTPFYQTSVVEYVTDSTNTNITDTTHYYLIRKPTDNFNVDQKVSIKLNSVPKNNIDNLVIDVVLHEVDYVSAKVQYNLSDKKSTGVIDTTTQVIPEKTILTFKNDDSVYLTPTVESGYIVWIDTTRWGSSTCQINDLAIYNGAGAEDTWTFEHIDSPQLFTVACFSDYGNITMKYYNGIFYFFEMLLPLIMTLNIHVDKNAVLNGSVVPSDEEDGIINEVATLLQLSNYTGTEISYYPAKIIDAIISNRRSWIKDITVTVTDQTGLEIATGIETLPEDEILTAIGTNKLNQLNYTSYFFSWDIDHISINYTID